MFLYLLGLQQTFGMNGYPKPLQQQQMPQQSQPNPYPSTPQQPQTPFAQKQQLQQQGLQGQFGFAQMNPPATPQNQAAAAMMQQQAQMQGNMASQQTPQQPQQMMQGNSPFSGNFPNSGQPNMGMQGSPPPMSMPGSPYRGAKRKIDSPHMGGATPAMSPMGPPSMMPNRISMSGPSGSGDLSAGLGMNGIPGAPNVGSGHQQGQSQGSSQSPHPPNPNEMMGLGVNLNATAGGMGGGTGIGPGQGPPQTPVRQGSMMGGGTPGLGAGQGVGIGGSGVGMGNASPMAQALAQQQQQQARQASLPPGASPMQKEAGSIGMGMGGMRASVPPAVPGPNVTGPVVRTPSTVAGTPVPGPSSASSVPPSTVSGGDALPAPNAAASSSTSSSMTGQLPPLPTNVQLNPAVTQVTHVPLIDSLKLIPDISDEQIVEIQGWMKRDKEYEVVMRKMKERMTNEVRGLFGGAMWWEKGAPDVDVNRWKRGREMFDVRYPLRRGKEKEGRERRKRQREGLRLCVRSLVFYVYIWLMWFPRLVCFRV